MRDAVSSGTLAIRLFGAPHFTCEETLENALPPRALSALAYLLLHRDREVQRDAMAFALWPDVPEEEARANLRRALYTLQRWLPERETPWFMANRRYVFWNEASPYWLDVREYEKLAEQQRFAEAAALYEGELLAGLEDEWIASERDRFQALHLGLLRRLAAQLRDSGDTAGAIACAQKALAIDPWREDFVRELIQLRALSGDRAGALNEYRTFEAALKREMNASPERETTEVFERVGSGERDALPPISAHAFANNLPAQLTSLIGREEEVLALKTLLDKHRLVTIAGAGGIGKTRLALRLGADVTDRYRDGVWLVEFAPISVEAFVPSTVAAALNIQESADRTLSDSVIQALNNRRALLIFDNCEHLVDATARFADEILRACPRVQIVATSRQPLNTEGEQLYRVNPLAFPESSERVTASRATDYSAIALFVERAQAARDSFKLTDENVAAVADICRRLDGIALAIELAAARVRVLSPSGLNEGLKARFRLLTGGSRTRLPRHQTLRALIDWSYALLHEREKLLLRRVSVFAGSFSLMAAAALCAELNVDELDVLDLLTSLVEKSLVNAETGTDSDRYRLPESTRRYLEELVVESGERDALLRLHAQYYRTFAERAGRDFQRTPQSVWFRTMVDEYENVREALLWSLPDGNDGTNGAIIAGCLEQFWFNCGRFREGLFWIESALGSLDELCEPGVAAKLHLARAVLLWGSNKLQAAERACELYERAGDCTGLGYALRQRALTLRQNQPQEAEDLCGRAVELLKTADDSGGFALALDTLGSILVKRGDFGSAVHAQEEALAVATRDGCEYATMLTLMYLSDSEFQRGNTQEAVRRGAQALSLAHSTRMPRLVLNARSNLAIYRIVLGEHSQAAGDLVEALSLVRNVQDGYSTAVVLQQVALLEAEVGNVAQAARLAGYVDTYFSNNRIEREATEKLARDRLENDLRDKLAEDTYRALFDAGAVLTEEQAVDEAQGMRKAAA